MSISQTTSRIGTALGTIGAIGAIVVLSASAQAATSKPAGMSQPEYRALTIRSKALNQEYALDRTRRPAKADYPGAPTPVERLVRQEDARRNDRQLGITRPTQVVPAPISPRIEVVANDEFDWFDAALGAASAAGIAGALGGAVIVVRGRTPRHA